MFTRNCSGPSARIAFAAARIHCSSVTNCGKGPIPAYTGFAISPRISSSVKLRPDPLTFIFAFGFGSGPLGSSSPWLFGKLDFIERSDSVGARIKLAISFFTSDTPAHTGQSECSARRMGYPIVKCNRYSARKSRCYKVCSSAGSCHSSS